MEVSRWYWFNSTHFSSWKRKFYELEKMWSELIRKKIDNMIKNFLFFLILFIFNYNLSYAENEIYKKIDVLKYWKNK